eukprot:1349497-Pyramimonas_sp.AAC.1
MPASCAPRCRDKNRNSVRRRRLLFATSCRFRGDPCTGPGRASGSRRVPSTRFFGDAAFGLLQWYSGTVVPGASEGV